MAKSLTLTSGSILAGNPIIFDIEPSAITGSNISFHRIICEVKAGITDGTYETIRMAISITDRTTQRIDISSALRVVLDSFIYTATPQTYPYVQWQVKVYDEYMRDGSIHTNYEEQYFPSADTYYRCIAGRFSDIERIKAANAGQSTLPVLSLTKKPSSTPQIIKVGETFAYTPPYTAEQTLPVSADLTAPESKVVNVTKEGLQTLGYQRVYALPASHMSQRAQFRFINSFGVLESISVPISYEQGVVITSDETTTASIETFTSFNRLNVRKRNDYEQWKYSTDPLDPAWHQWFIHEFLMASHVWTLIAGIWLRCIITTDDDILIINNTQDNYRVVQFTAKLDLTGSPYVY